MFIQVRLLNGFKEPLLYEVPPTWSCANLVGTIVRVPLRANTTTAIIEKVMPTRPQTTYAIKPATAIEPFPADNHYTAFITQLATYYQTNTLFFIRRIQQFLTQKEVRTGDEQPVQSNTQPKKIVTLTAAQQTCVDALTPHIINPTFKPTVLHGVTGSGKTEVYKRLIQTAITQGKTVLLLLPEVSLATQFSTLLRAQLDQSIALYNFHSATGVKEKRALWKTVLAQQPILIIGVHLPVLLPIANLGLIIIDEEHEPGYQEQRHPKINTKEAALLRAQLHAIPILLGSATPSIATLYNVKTKGWDFFQLKERFSGNFPTVKVVPLNDSKERRSFWISTALEQAIKKKLAVQEQTIIFLNRRGHSFFVQCKQCSFIFSCNSCSVSLTLHANDTLHCHYCTFERTLPAQCESCKAGSKDFIKKGIGTQQVVTILQKLFPHARIARADMDTTKNKKEWQQTIQGLQEGTIDILVGTQTITKGYHFPKVTLVGVLWADLNLHFPIYNAAETTLQQLIQVAGRAGRQSQESSVIIQTMTTHPIFNFVDELRYPAFYEHELEKRAMIGYPPMIRLAEIEFKNSNEEQVERESEMAFTILEQIIKTYGYQVKLLGPAKPPVYKIKNIHVRKLYLKGMQFKELALLFAALKTQPFASSLAFTPNPVN